MINEAQIQSELNRVASGDLSVFDFGEWLDQQSWRDIGRLPSEVFRLVSAIDREFAEYDHHHREDVLMRGLLELLPRRSEMVYWSDVPEPLPIFSSSMDLDWRRVAA